MTAGVKPLVHWALFHKYSLRYTMRQPERVEGVFGTPAGSVPFQYSPPTRMLIVNGSPAVTLNEYGWEVDAQGEIIIKSYKPRAADPQENTPENTPANETPIAGTGNASTEIEAADGAGVSE